VNTSGRYSALGRSSSDNTQAFAVYQSIIIIIIIIIIN